jgi:hypothetical protein
MLKKTLKLKLAISVFFIGKLLPIFDLKNMISTYIKDFSWNK